MTEISLQMTQHEYFKIQTYPTIREEKYFNKYSTRCAYGNWLRVGG